VAIPGQVVRPQRPRLAPVDQVGVLGRRVRVGERALDDRVRVEVDVVDADPAEDLLLQLVR
jgi:hypothetical protein